MSPAGPGTGQQPARRRDAARSRELLLRAAVELFAERGFERTTIREIGDRAGVDPALIARYFGGKTQLYIAAVHEEHGEATPADLLDPERLRWLLGRIERRGAGPVFQAAMVPSDDPAVQEAARGQLHRRLVGPLRDRFVREGVDRPELRAELAVAAFIGVALARSGGALEQLAEADSEELLALLHELLSSAAPQPPPAPPTP